MQKILLGITRQLNHFRQKNGLIEFKSYNLRMQGQNIHFFKGNKSHSPADIHIYELPTPQPIQTPNFSLAAFKPLAINFHRLKQKFYSSSNFTNQQRQQSGKFLLTNQRRPLTSNNLHTLINQNQLLKNQLQRISQLLQEEKHKYNLLKNLYKQGETMFETLQQKSILLQKQNKQIKTVLQNVLKELHSKNESLESLKMAQNTVSSRRVQKVKIGNRQIPVIKVNVPPETFSKKQHSNSVFSINQQQGGSEHLKEKMAKLKEQNENLTEKNAKLDQELKQLKKSLSRLESTFQKNDKKTQTKQKDSAFFLAKQQRTKIEKQEINTDLHKNTNMSSQSFNFYLSNSEKYSNNNQNPNTQSSNYRDSQSNISYFKSKYAILETQLKKKDQTIKNLYDQCYLLQFQINRLKASPNKTTDISNQKIHQNTQNSQKLDFHLNEAKGESETAFYKRKIHELQGQIDELNKICIGNVNNSFKMNQLNEIISKLTRQIGIYQQKITAQQTQLSRLYKILENKNLELSEIYSVMSETKKSQLFEDSKLLESSKLFDGNKRLEQKKPFQGSNRKSFENLLVSTPQKYEHQTRRKGFSEKQFMNNFTTQ